MTYLSLLGAISPMELTNLLLWYLGLKKEFSINLDGSPINVSEKFSKGEAIWLLKIISKAKKKGIIIKISNDKEITLKMNNSKISINLEGSYLIFLSYVLKLYENNVKIYEGKVILPNGIELRYPMEDPLSLSIIDEVFFEEQWGFLNVCNKEVVDVGGYVGESAVYFALKGAAKVTVFEPNPSLYKIMVDNIRINGLQDKIIAHNYAVSSREGVVNLDVPPGRLMANARAAPSVKGLHVKSTRLPEGGDILKMDCEGCEYDVLLDPNFGDLPYEEIGLEYHSSPEILVNKLKKFGYKVKVTRKSRKIGFIHAWRDSVG